MKPGAAAERGFRQKRSKYGELENGVPSNVVIFVVETGGRFHVDAMRFVELVALNCAESRRSEGETQGQDELARAMRRRVYQAIDAELAKSAAHMMASLLGDLAVVRDHRVREHEFLSAIRHSYRLWGCVCLCVSLSLQVLLFVSCIDVHNNR